MADFKDAIALMSRLSSTIGGKNVVSLSWDGNALQVMVRRVGSATPCAGTVDTEDLVRPVDDVIADVAQQCVEYFKGVDRNG